MVSVNQSRFKASWIPPEILVLQEAFKPSQVFPELILALYLKHLKLHKFWIKSGTKSIILFWENRLTWVLQSCQKPKEDQRWLASIYVGLGPSRD